MTTQNEPRWYMVNNLGMATLCNNKADAENEAKTADACWPNMAPHRAVQLVEASFDSHDMATAAAEGFRDGASEIDALKGQRRVLCDLLRECLPIIDAMLQMPGDDASDAHLQGLQGRINDALVAVAEERAQECRA